MTGPSVALSFFIGGVISWITMMCFSELSSHIPSNGGHYTFIYIYYGEIFSWISLCLMTFEFGFSGAICSVGLVESIGSAFKGSSSTSVPQWIFKYQITELVVINPMASLIVLFVTFIMMRGV